MTTIEYYHSGTWFYAVCHATKQAWYVQATGAVRGHRLWSTQYAGRYEYVMKRVVGERGFADHVYKRVTKCAARRIMKQMGFIEQPFPTPNMR